MKRVFFLIALLLLQTVSAPASDKLKLSTVVIDAGHGGNDPGCVSSDKKTYEKTLTLDISRRLASKISAAYPDVKVIQTRTGDKFVTLDDRPQIANKAGANLFISIHINATTSKSPSGYSVHVLGQSSKKNRDLYANNMEVCKRENSVILLEDDYSTKYMGFDPSDPESYIFMLLMQNAHLEQSVRFAQIINKNLAAGPLKVDRGLHQDPFYVLWKTAMPSVLVELGFISNTADLAILRDEKKRDQLADCLFKAFKEYKILYDSSLDISSTAPETEPQAEKPADKAPKSETTKPVDKAPKEEAAKPADKADTGGNTPAEVNGGEQAGVQASASEAPTAETSESKTLYAIQVLVSGKLLPEDSSMFMGYKPKIIRIGKLYKYFICVDEKPQTPKQNLQKVKKKFPDCFTVVIEGESVKRLK